MEYSDYYKRRQECLAKLEVPTISEIVDITGKTLSDVMFNQCPEALKELVGLTPPLEGAGDDLWISPSDLLIGKVCLKPPLTSKHMKALTHQGILEIGVEIEQKYWNEMELEKKRCLEEQEELLKFKFETEKRNIVQAALEEEQQLCNCIIENLKSEFEEKLQAELARLESEMSDNFDQILNERMDEREKQWQERLDEAVKGTVKSLTETFLQDLQNQTEDLILHYESLVKKEQVKCRLTLENEKTRHRDTMKQLRHYLECKNVANMMYVLCMERRKCQKEREAIELQYQKEVEKLHDKLKEKEIAMRTQEEESKEKQRKLEIREQCVLEILRQFQKFINFALRASPTQAEFLLSIEKMMLFELTAAIAEQDALKLTSVASTLLPWKTPSSSSTGTEIKSLTVPDHHDCCNLTEDSSEYSLRSGDALPALHYNKHMYVREDFRNMFSQGIPVTPNSMLWNKDVDNLMQVLRSTVSSEKKAEAKEKDVMRKKTTEEKVAQEKEVLVKTRVAPVEAKPHSKLSDTDIVSLTRSDKNGPKTSRSQNSRRSSVHFTTNPPIILLPENVDQVKDDINNMLDNLNLEKPHTASNTDKPKQCSKSSLRRESSLRTTDDEVIDFAAVGKEEKRKTILATRNSLDLLKEAFDKIKTDVEKTEEEEQRNSELEEIIVGVVCEESPTASVEESKKDSLDVEELMSHHRDSLQKHRKSVKTYYPMSDTMVSLTEGFRPDNLRRVSISVAVKEPSVAIEISGSFEPSIMNEVMVNPLPQIVSQRTSHASLSLKASPISSKKKLNVKVNKTSSFTESKLTLARDSLLIHKESLMQKTSMMSKLSLARDSLEVLQERRTSKADESNADLKQEQKIDNAPRESRLSMARDSVEMLKGSLLLVPDPHAYTVSSKLSMHRDSLELIKASARSSKDYPSDANKNGKTMSKESIEVLDGIISNSDSTRVHSSVIKLDDDGSRVVKMSHIEVVEIDEQPSVSINLEPVVLGNVNSVVTGPPPEIYVPSKVTEKKVEKPKSKKVKRDSFLRKPNQAKVVGDREAKEHVQKNEEFTLHRVNSLLTIFKKHPSLIKMFTSVSQ